MKDHEILEDIQKVAREEQDKEDQTDKYRWVKIIFWLVIGLIMILLMISFVFVTYPISGIIGGKLESNILNNNVIELDEFDVVFEDNTLKQLQNIYFNEQKVEFSVCLLGNKDNNIYDITNLYKPVTYSQTFNSVSFEPCSDETLIILHSHPYKSCIASQADISMLARSKERNKDVLMVVMCEPERFSVYS